MRVRQLVYLGPVSPQVQPSDAALRCEGEPLEVNAICPLERRRSPWNAHRTHERVIVGSHPTRADVLLTGDGVYPEHLRLYFPKTGDGATDMKVINEDSVRLNGEPVEAHGWISLHGGEEIVTGPWRWRYELRDSVS